MQKTELEIYETKGWTIFIALQEELQDALHAYGSSYGFSELGKISA